MCAVRSVMAKAMKDAVQAAWNGEDPRHAMESAGQAGAEGIRAYIDSHIPPPNSPVTVSGGWIWNRKARKGVYVSGKEFNKPLFDELHPVKWTVKQKTKPGQEISGNQQRLPEIFFRESTGNSTQLSSGQGLRKWPCGHP